MSEGSNTRRLPRYQFVLPVAYRATSKGASASKEGSGWTRNISETGACLELAESLPSGTRLALTILDESGGLSLEARTIWVSYPPVADGGTLHGVAFEELSLHQRLVLSALLHRHAGLRVQATRLPAAFPVLCHPLGPAGAPLRGWTGNLGRAGCLLLLPESLGVGTLIAVTLTTPRGDVAAEATVVWVEAGGPAGTRHLTPHGIRFIDASDIQDTFLAMTLEGNPTTKAGSK
jgi:hypothetical protein